MRKIKEILNNFANSEKEGSLANKFRKRRFLLLRELIKDLPRPLSIIDVGGTVSYWEKMGFFNFDEKINVVIINLKKYDSKYLNIISYVGDARNLSQFEDQSFDLAFSNSVIEHVGSLNDQKKMIDEMRRVAKRIYLQTPNRFFPIEPHFIFPFFQFFPNGIKVWLLMKYSLGWFPKFKDKEKAYKAATSIRLMNKKEIQKFFPNGNIIKEKFIFFCKSFVVIEGFKK